MSDIEQSGIAAPMVWTKVPNPNDQPGMTDEEVQEFLDRPIEPMARLTGKNVPEGDDNA